MTAQPPVFEEIAEFFARFPSREEVRGFSAIDGETSAGERVALEVQLRHADG